MPVVAIILTGMISLLEANPPMQSQVLPDRPGRLCEITSQFTLVLGVQPNLLYIVCIQVEERSMQTLNANLFSHACQVGLVHMISAITFKEAFRRHSGSIKDLRNTPWVCAGTQKRGAVDELHVCRDLEIRASVV